jgi:hypothetical protein
VTHLEAAGRGNGVLEVDLVMEHLGGDLAANARSRHAVTVIRCVVERPRRPVGADGTAIAGDVDDERRAKVPRKPREELRGEHLARCRLRGKYAGHRREREARGEAEDRPRSGAYRKHSEAGVDRAHVRSRLNFRAHAAGSRDANHFVEIRVTHEGCAPPL